MSVVHEIWRRTAPRYAEARYRSLASNFSILKASGYLPEDADKVMDVGYGSGAATIHLKEMYPNAEIIAVDDASTQQYNPQYLRRTLPKWTDITVAHKGVDSVDLGVHGCDIVFASRFPFIWAPIAGTWKEENLQVAQRVLSVARFVGNNGSLFIGYNIQEDGHPPVLHELRSLINFSALFSEVNLLAAPVHSYNDDWLVLSRPRNMSMSPEDILTEYASMSKPPFRGFFRHDDD